MSAGIASLPRVELMRDLSAAFPGWAVWKSLDRTIAGRGDIDAIASSDTWPKIASIFQGWAFAQGFDGVIGCRHVPGVVLLMAVRPDRAALSELDLCDTFYWRGGRLITAADVVSFLVDDERGIRRFRPGAEGLFLLLFNGLSRGGRRNAPAIRDQHVIELLGSDPDGVQIAAATLGRIGPAALALAAAVEEGRWDRWAALRAEVLGVANATLEPGSLAGRLGFRIGADRTCPIVAATRGYGGKGEDMERWLTTPTALHSLARA